jgi:DnaJ-class molecular chaperone
MNNDPYKILEVSKNTPLNEIEKKYKKMALKYHPDRNLYDKEICEEKFKEISNAYNSILKNKNKTNFNNSDFNDINNSYFNDSNLENIKNNIMNKGKFLKNIIFNLRNMEYDTIFTNLIKEINTLSDYYEEKNNNKQTENLIINAKIDLIDIYNNTNQSITIKRLRKCNKCLSLGIIIENNKTNICSKCNGDRYKNENVILEFNSKNKSITFPKLSHQILGHITGDIILNIIPKYNNHSEFKIINYYDILYYHYFNLPYENKDNIIIEFKYLDNKIYKFNINNPYYNFEYNIENMGLQYVDNDTRGNLIIILIEKNNVNNTSINQII